VDFSLTPHLQMSRKELLELIAKTYAEKVRQVGLFSGNIGLFRENFEDVCVSGRVLWAHLQNLRGQDMYGMTHLHVWHGVFECGDMTQLYVTRLILIWHDSSTCLAWLIHVYHMTFHLSLMTREHGSFVCEKTHLYVTRLIRMSQDSFVAALLTPILKEATLTRLVHMFGMTHPHVPHDFHLSLIFADDIDKRSKLNQQTLNPEPCTLSPNPLVLNPNVKETLNPKITDFRRRHQRKLQAHQTNNQTYLNPKT